MSWNYWFLLAIIIGEQIWSLINFLYHYNAGDMLTVPVTSDCIWAIKAILLPSVSFLSDDITVETFSKKILIGLIIVMDIGVEFVY